MQPHTQPHTRQDEPLLSPEARLFLALWPRQEERAELARYLAAWIWPRGSSPVKDERLHLTLHFIGQAARERLPAIRVALQTSIEPFALTFTRAETWPRGLVVLSANDTPAALAQLHATLADSLRRLGLPVETRRFRPHVTLARCAGGAAPPAHPPRLCWQIDHYLLVESILGHGGGYRIVEQYR